MAVGNARERFEANLTQACRVKRRPVSADTDLDMVLGEEAIEERRIACLICPLALTDDMIAAGKEGTLLARLLATYDADVQARDTVVDLGSGEEWIVTEKPVVRRLRGEPHHLEALIERRRAQ
jgi:hypothetical protein